MTSSVKSNAHHRPVYDTFSIGDRTKPNASELKSKSADVDSFISRPQTSSSTISAPAQTIAAWTEASLGNHKERHKDRMPGSTPSLSTSLPTAHADFNRRSLIFSPPNCVDDRVDMKQTTSFEKGREPVKAAGDVSLSGKQLLPFLYKASLRLPNTKAAGVQLRLNQLEVMVNDNLLSDHCIKKLNFIVDAIDRGAYDEAWRYFEAMRDAFPLEMSSNWANALKLLICELKPQQRMGRVGSAGSHVRSQ